MASWGQNAASAITIDSDPEVGVCEEEHVDDDSDPQSGVSEGDEETEEDDDEDNESDKDSCDEDSEGDSSDDDDPALKRWKMDLTTRLDSIQTAGDFATCNSMSVFANPGLEVNGNPIPLPLTARDAGLLKAACRQAPFGRGDETVVDESVRKTWELDHGQFRIANPSWPKFLKLLTQQAADSLGMLQVQVEPYKLLLYEEGSFFKRHKDSEKVEGMIGTLVICLPSSHEGGDVVLSLGGKSQRFSTSSASAYDLSALAWYSDVTHEITKLTSGYRLVLTYNIVQQGSQNPSPSDLIKQQSAIENLLQGSVKQFKGLRQMFYPLEHKYTQASLSLKNMKGRDRAVCQALDHACRKHGYYLLLANLTKTEPGKDDYYEDEDEDEDEDNETTFQLDSIHAPDGRELPSYLDIEAKDILGATLDDKREPDSEDEGEFTGNESMPSTYRYHDTAAMIIPKKHFHRLLRSGHKSEKVLLDIVVEDLRQNQDDKTTRASAVTLMDELATPYSIAVPSNANDNGIICATIAEWALKLERNDIYQKSVRKAIWARDCHLLIHLIARHLNAQPTGDKFAGWDFWLAGFLDYNGDVEWMETLMATLTSLIESNDLLESLSAWQVTLLPRQLDRKPTFGLHDQAFMSEVFGIILRDPQLEMLRNSWIRAITERGHKHLLYRILPVVIRQASNSPVSKITHKPIGVEVLHESEPKLCLEMSDFPIGYANTYSWNASTHSYAYSLSGSTNTIPQMASDGDHAAAFLNLVDCCFQQGHGAVAIDLMEESCASILREPLPRTVSMRIEPMQQFLVEVCTVFQKYNTAFPPFTKQLWEALLQEYIWKCLPSPPQQPRGLAHRPRGCNSPSCVYCPMLDAFLVSETEQVFELQATQKERSHVESRLDRGLFRIRANIKPERGKAHVLIITKIPGKEYEDDWRVYRQRLGEIHRRLEPLRVESVRRAIGDGPYASLVLLEPASGAQVVAHPSMTGQKRGALEELENSRPAKIPSIKY